MKRTLIVVRKAPFGTMDSWEAMRLSLSFYAADSPVDILLQRAGVLNWVSGIIKESLDPHSVSRLVEDVSRFDIPVLLAKEDLLELGLEQSDLANDHPKVITRQESRLLPANYETTIEM